MRETYTIPGQTDSSGIFDQTLGAIRTPEPVSRPHVEPVPADVLVVPEHVWLRPEPSRLIRLGVDRLLLTLLGGLDCVYVLSEGAEIRRGGPLVMLHRGRRALQLRSPVDGVISEVNHRARRTPALVSSDPFEKGWIYTIAPARLSDALKGAIAAEVAPRWMQEEIRRLRHLVQGALVDTAPTRTAIVDDVLPLAGLARRIGDAQWEELVQKFFGTPRPGKVHGRRPRSSRIHSGAAFPPDEE